MIRLYADEKFPLPVVRQLRALGYDVLTVQEAGQTNPRISDEQALALAMVSNRAVITQNRRDFVRLHQQCPDHAGIIACSKNLDWDDFTANIHKVLGSSDAVVGELIRIIKDLS